MRLAPPHVLAALLVAVTLSGCAGSATGGAWSPKPRSQYDAFRDSTVYTSAPVLAVNQGTYSLTLMAAHRCPGRNVPCETREVAFAVAGQAENRIPLAHDTPVFLLIDGQPERFAPRVQEATVGGGLLGQNTRSLAYFLPRSVYERMANAADVQMRLGEGREVPLPFNRREAFRRHIAGR